MKFLSVSLVILLTVIPEALSIECYFCSNANGNCESNKITCPSFPIKFDTCMKLKTGDVIAKSCSTSSKCSAKKDLCKSSGACEAWCCDSDGCNGGVPLKPVTFLTLLAMALGVAKYLM